MFAYELMHKVKLSHYFFFHFFFTDFFRNKIWSKDEIKIKKNPFGLFSN